MVEHIKPPHAWSKHSKPQSGDWTQLLPLSVTEHSNPSSSDLTQLKESKDFFFSDGSSICQDHIAKIRLLQTVTQWFREHEGSFSPWPNWKFWGFALWEDFTKSLSHCQYKISAKSKCNSGWKSKLKDLFGQTVCIYHFSLQNFITIQDSLSEQISITYNSIHLY